MKIFLDEIEIRKLSRETGTSMRFCRIVDRLTTVVCWAATAGAVGAMAWLIPKWWKALSLLVCVMVCAGCASMTQKVRTVTNHPDGTIEVREIEARGNAFWDAKGSLDKLRVSNGKTTQSIGLSGVDTDVTSTNIAATIEALTKLLQTLRP